MGQQETTMTVAEEKGGGTLRRMILALLVAALMAAMMAVGAGSAFAASDKANIVGRSASFFNKEVGHGQGGKLVAHEAPVGDVASKDK